MSLMLLDCYERRQMRKKGPREWTLRGPGIDVAKQVEDGKEDDHQPNFIVSKSPIIEQIYRPGLLHGPWYGLPMTLRI